MRFLVLFVLALVLALASAQSVSNSNTNSWTPSVTPSWTVTPSNSWTASNSWTNSASWTKSNTNSWTSSTSNTQTGTPTGTYPQPAAPTNLANSCPGHIVTMCLQWEDEGIFNFYRVYFQSTVAGSAINVATSDQPQLQITTLTASTTYNVWVAGVDTGVGVWSGNSSVITVTTSALDPKADPNLDVQNFACSTIVNSDTKRVNVECKWDAADVTVHHINLKGRCVSSIREPLLIRKSLYGTKAQATSVVFRVNRDTATCNFYARFYYARRPTTRKHFRLSY